MWCNACLPKASRFSTTCPLSEASTRLFAIFFDYFSPTTRKEFEQVVAVTLGETGMQVIGFVTQPLSERMPESFREEDSVLVYLP